MCECVCVQLPSSKMHLTQDPYRKLSWGGEVQRRNVSQAHGAETLRTRTLLVNGEKE